MQSTRKSPLAAAVACVVALAAAQPGASHPLDHVFDPYFRLPVYGNAGYSMRVGDVTGDGRDDIVLATIGSLGDARDANQVLVYRQAANGTLLAPLRFTHAGSWSDRLGLALGRLNGDAALDIVVGLNSGFMTLVTAPGGFAIETYPTAAAAETVGIVDIDRDGHADVVGQTWSSGAVAMFGSASGVLAQPTGMATNGYGYNDLKTGDLNGDGTDDVLIASAQGMPDFSYYPVAPDGSGWLPTAKVTYPSTYKGMAGVAIGDFNGDGAVDVATSTGGNIGDPMRPPYITMFAGDGHGRYATPLPLPSDSQPTSLASGDLDNNGKTDLVVAHPGAIGYYLQANGALQKERVLGAAFTSNAIAPQALAVGDVDSNGCADIVVADPGGVMVLLGRNCAYRKPAKPRAVAHDYDGDGRSDVLWRNAATGDNAAWRAADNRTPQTVAGVKVLDWKIAGQGDFDGDGRDDIVWRNARTGANTIWRAGDYRTQIAVSTLAPAWTLAVAGDFNKDGKADLVWRNATTGQNVMWRSGNSAMATTVFTHLQWTIVGAGDFDGDGASDLLWRNASTGANTIWRSANAATTLAVTTVNNPAWKVQGVGDFNRDGRADIVWRNTSTGANQTWNDGKSTQARTLPSTPAQWQLVAVGDYDGDGMDDLLWRNSATGANVFWRRADAAHSQVLASVTNQAWKILP